MKQGDGVKRVQVLPDVPAIDSELTYLLPTDICNFEPPLGSVESTESTESSENIVGSIVGSIVQIPLKGRKVRGWITGELDNSVKLDYELKPITKFESLGPPKDVLELADWAAQRWVSRRVAFYRAASPNKKISKKKINEPFEEASYKWPSLSRSPNFLPKFFSEFPNGNAVLRIPPIFDIWEIIESILQFTPLIISPFPKQAREIAERLKSFSLPVALLPEEWSQARAGGSIVVGTRPAIFAPFNPGIILVLDENEESHTSESSPTYNTRDVAQKRAADLKIPCLMTSKIPSPEVLASSKLFTVGEKVERMGWPKIEIVDCTDTERQMEGLITEPLLRQLRQKNKRIICILNRKGRIRLLACKKCKKLIKCKRCGSALQQNQVEKLDCIKCQLSRSSSCSHCGSVEFKQLRLGVSKLRENLEILLKESIGELTADSRKQLEKDKRILVSTTAALYDDLSADVVAFLDFDQELLSPNIRAHEQAFASLTRAGALLNNSKKLILIQTRMPEHSVIESALKRDTSILSTGEANLRKELGFPPSKAVAEIARSGADEFITSLKANSKSKSLEIFGPVEDRYLVRANTIEELCDVLNKIPRPKKKKLRIAINPIDF